ncbi:peptidase S8 and S53 subtilisin kexin sedolisin [mine drainage metagenome]|uniref:Peptidase S8 and S53 subtilisin kexin sedolisin n=2 Tax=mine drainage metagenome TaxID=410659 RepID=T0YNW7_9ZZZZ
MMAYDPSDGYVVLYGGYTNTNPTSYLSDTWTYSDGTWTQLSGTAPPARAGGAFAWDGADHELVLFGGVNVDGIQLGDTWTFAGGAWSHDTGSTNNSAARMASMMTYKTADGYLVMYGGYTQASGGGYDGTGYFNDLWEFKAGQWTQLTLAGPLGVPPPMYGAAMTFDAYDGYVVMFGGRENTYQSYMPYTWEYNGGDWYNISSSTAPPVWNCGAVVCEEEVAYDALDKQVVYATETSGGSEETWFFQSGTWTDVTSTANAVPTGLDEAMAWDGADGYVLDFSGLNLPASAWIYPGPLTASVVPNQPGVDVGQTLDLTAVVTGGTPAYTYSWPALPAGCSSSDSATISCQPTTVGATSAVVKVTDSSGGRSATSATLALTISPALTVATPNGSKPFSDVNEPISFGTSTTGGPGTYLTYSWTKVPLGCSSVNASALPCTPASPGTYPVQVTVTDGNHYAVPSTSLPYTVLSNPSVTIAENRTVLDLGESILFWANASGGSGVYTYTYNNLPAGCSTANVSVLSCTPSTTVSSTFVTASIVDTVGGTASSGSVYFGVKPDPTLSLSWAQGGTPSYANASLTVLLTYGSGNPQYHPCFNAPGSNYPSIVAVFGRGARPTPSASGTPQPVRIRSLGVSKTALAGTQP